ncbi:MAG TPA: DUF481 domain-containing protein [Planctomycetota bacterium]|nr:DUF481 domain-containing protein [Planctomycetota bacterium]
MKRLLIAALCAAAAVGQSAGVLPDAASLGSGPRELTDFYAVPGGAPTSCVVLAVGADGVTVETASGERRLSWIDVAHLETAGPIVAALRNGDRATLRLLGVEGGRLKAHSDAFGAVTLDPSTFAPLPSPALPPQDAAAKKTPLTPTDWKGTISLNGSFRSGTVDSVLVALRAAVEKSWEEDKFSAALEALYGESDDLKTNESLFAKARFEHYWSDRFFGYGQADALYDRIQDIDLRAIAGVGVGYVVWKDSDDELLSFEGGVSGIYTKYGTGVDELSPAARVGATFKEILFKDVRFEQTAEFLLPLDDMDAFLVRARTSLAVPVAEGWSMKTSVDLQYQGEPAAGTENLDILFLIGLEYQF